MIDIKLKVDEYCKDCPHFSYAVGHRRVTSTYNDTYDHYISISCENTQMCKHLKRYLEDKKC